ncbi:MAG: adenylosuccinate lyase [Acidimicrobiia bacterium]
MIERYALPEMSAIWSEANKLAVWKQIETLVVEAWVDLGVATAEAAEAVRNAPEVDPEAWREWEQVTNHDLAAFVDLLAGSVEVGGEWVHFGLTSSDVVDTANGVFLREAADLLLTRVVALFTVIKAKAFEYRDTPIVGRTHGIWAEPTSFGLKLASWAFEMERDYRRLSAARDSVAVGKISGAVGTYAHTPPAVEAYVCTKLGLGVETASSQITHRDRHAEFLNAIALTGSSLERFATEIRHLQRSEVGEARESFGSGQKGSSAMPHKRNPIASENITGISRLLRGYASVGMENVALWHERDISHSSAERITFPDATGLLDYALVRTTRLVDGLVINIDRMAENLEATRGLIFSQAVLLALAENGHARDDAYRIVQRNAMAAWDEGGNLRDRLAADPECDLTDDDLATCFSMERFLRNTGDVFDLLEGLSL